AVGSLLAQQSNRAALQCKRSLRQLRTTFAPLWTVPHQRRAPPREREVEVDMTSRRPVALACLLAFAVLSFSFSRAAEADQPPVVIAPPNVTVNEGQQICFEITSLDPAGAPTFCSVTNIPPSATFSPGAAGGGRFCWTPPFNAAGTYSVTFTCCNS